MESTATATREHPILFNGDMVRAILDGRKVQTRRVVRWSEKTIEADRCELHETRTGRLWPYNCCDEWEKPIRCPYGQPGDHLYIRTGCTATYNVNRNQTWWSTSIPGCGRTTHGHPRRSDGTPMKLRNGCASMYTPKWLSLELFPVLEVTDVHVKRVGDISEADAMSEGLIEWTDPPRVTGKYYGVSRADCWEEKASAAFARVWDSINGKRPGCSWAENPFVWVIEFKQI